MNRKVKKFFTYMMGDDISENLILDSFNKFVQGLRDKGYIPVREPTLDKHYYKQEKGQIITYEDGTVAELPADKHIFWMRCIYLGKKKANEMDYLKVSADSVVLPNKDWIE